MDGIGGLLHALGESFAGLVSGAVHAAGDALRGAVASLQSVLPGLWLPIVAVVVLVIVGWNLAKR